MARRMTVCVVGSGGREHALAVALGRTADVMVAPGNAGIPGSVDLDPRSVDADLFVIGPEKPLVDGLADELRAGGALVYGPGADGARLEGSKAWMKEVVQAAGVPTAAFGAFNEPGGALEYLRSSRPPYVVKTDGLAAGKGVLVTNELIEAEDDVRAKLAGESFGQAGATVVIEEGMSGPELSVQAVCDGKRAVMLAPARDYKRVRDADLGPNTGGMGAFSPVPDVPDDLLEVVAERFIAPTLAELGLRGIDYRGTLYAGLMLTPEGPKLVEYNVRFGDPETQAVLPRLESDLAALLASAAGGELCGEPVFSARACVTVACASEGYPGTSRTGDLIRGLDRAASPAEVTIHFAGVSDAGGDMLHTAGGRVLYVTATGPDLETARGAVYDAVGQLKWQGMHHRSDIAGDLR